MHFHWLKTASPTIGSLMKLGPSNGPGSALSRELREPGTLAGQGVGGGGRGWGDRNTGAGSWSLEKQGQVGLEVAGRKGWGVDLTTATWEA